MTTNGLKAMFWKECRENARWAVLALLALSLGLAYAWFHLYQQSSFPSLGQIWSGENLVLTITTPLIGLALGLLQILPELRRDQWAFLVHRPASRTTLFFGKVLPGVCLYLLATILPLLGLAAWAASPSHVPAPFDFRFTLAGWAAILSGLPFYFAGLLVALRPARWYGSRTLPLLTALLAPWQASSRTEVWQVALLCLLVTAPLFCAAWGSFLTGGEYKEQTKPARFALGLTLYPAVLVVSSLVLMLLVGVSNALNHSTNYESWFNDTKIDMQGRLFRTAEHTDSKGHTTRTVTDGAGRPVDPRLWQNLTQQHKFLDLSYLSVTNGASREGYPYSDPTRYVLDLRSRLSDDRQTHLYYVRQWRQAALYDGPSGAVRLQGYLGPNGFSPDAARAGQFEDAMPVPTYSLGQRLLQFPHAVYWYTEDKVLGLLHSDRSGVGITGVAVIANPLREGVYVWDRMAYLVAANGQVTAYVQSRPGANPAMRMLFTAPLAFDSKDYPTLQVAMAPDKSRFFFWYSAPGVGRPDHVVTLASDGRILKTETVTPPVTSAAVTQPTPFLQGLPALLVPPAATATAAVYAVIGHALKDQTAESWWRGFDNGGLLFGALFFSACGGLVAAIPAWLICRRLGDGRRGQIAWALGVFWLGGYGVLLLLALRTWPARVPCPHCGRQRVVDNETCEHCGAAFARPKRDGTEIFDAAGREAEPARRG